MRFHAVYWPAFLMSAGVEVPRRIFSHGFLFNRGEKMSKSVGNVIDPFALADAYGVDQLRYFFLREVPFGQDGNYSLEAIVNRINADLANDLGNLAQRSLSMIARQLGGVLPKPGAFSDADKPILALADGMIGKAREAMKTQQLHQVLNTVWAVVAEANRYFAGEAPWALAKTDPARQGTVLYVTAEVLRQVAIMAQPFMPGSAGKLLDLLAVPAGERQFNELGGGQPDRRRQRRCRRPMPVFPRYVDSEAKRTDLMLIDSHCHLDFPDFAGELDAVIARAQCAGHRAHGDHLDAGQTACRGARHRRTVSRRVSARSAPTRTMPMRSSTFPYDDLIERARTIPRSWRSERRGSITTTISARVKRRNRASATTLPPRAPPACRSSSIRVTPTRTWRGSWRRRSGRGAFPAVLHCFTGGRDLARRRSRSVSSSRSPGS